MPRPKLMRSAGDGASWSCSRAARIAEAMPFSSPISQMVRRVSLEDAKVPISPVSLRRLSDFIELAEPESSASTFTGAFEYCMDVLQKTRQQRGRQRTIQLAVISKLKTLQKRRAMLKAKACSFPFGVRWFGSVCFGRGASDVNASVCTTFGDPPFGPAGCGVGPTNGSAMAEIPPILIQTPPVFFPICFPYIHDTYMK